MMSSTVYMILSAVGVLSLAHVCRDRRYPRHRADSPSLAQHATSAATSAVTPAVGLALVVAGSNAITAPVGASEPAAAVSVVPVWTPADPASVPVSFADAHDIPHPKRALAERMRARKARVSRTLRRTRHVKYHLSSAPKPVVHQAPKPVTVKPAPVHHVPTPRKPVSTHISKPKPKPRPAVTPKATGSVRDRIISIAKTAIGLPYVYGAETPGVAFDCSGLTEWVFSKVGVNLPRTSQAQYRVAHRVSTPRPGDLVFYLNSTGAYHVGIYYKPGYMIVAPHTGTVVQIESIYGSPVYASVL